MSGFSLGRPLGLPPTLATACAAIPGPSDHRGATSRRGTPAMALLVSGGLHAAALTLFLLASARSGLDTERLIPVRVNLTPRIDVIDVQTPPAVIEPRAAGPRAKSGVIEPVDPKTTVAGILDDMLKRVAPTTGGPPGNSPVNSGRTGGSPDAPGYLAPLDTSDPDVPSRYDEAPVPIVAPEPLYPEIAREAGIEGRVVVEALVTREGTVREVRVRGGDATLADAAAKAVRAWKFRPARRNGRGVAAWVSVPVLFRLQ